MRHKQIAIDALRDRQPQRVVNAVAWLKVAKEVFPPSVFPETPNLQLREDALVVNHEYRGTSWWTWLPFCDLELLPEWTYSTIRRQLVAVREVLRLRLEK